MGLDYQILTIKRRMLEMTLKIVIHFHKILHISALDNDIKICIEKSYNVRDKKQMVLKRSHPNLNEI